MTVASILRHKDPDVVSVAPGHSVADIATVLAERRIGAALVQDGGAVVGIVSERDIIQGLAKHGAHALDLTAADLMTRAVQTTTPATSVNDAMQIMTTGRFRHLPVMDGGALVGIISIGDVVKSRLDTQAQEVDSLRAYVAGG